jgi:prepilin-type processing-associated H-X9-DG protein
VSLPPVCILAGGLGSRLGAASRDLPKPIVEVAGKPFLAHVLELLRSHGAQRVVLCVGYLGELIENRLGDGAQFGLELRYRYDPPGLAGTAGAVRAALDDLGERFLVLYGDTYLRVDYADVARRPGEAVMTVLENAGRWDRSNVLYADGRVLRYDKRDPTPDMRWIDYGLSVLTPGVLGSEDDLADVFARLAAEGRLAGYLATERFYEIGTPEALAETEAFLSGRGGSAG